jgi:hypothetical protein
MKDINYCLTFLFNPKPTAVLEELKESLLIFKCPFKKSNYNKNNY